MQEFLKEKDREWVENVYRKLEGKIETECGRMGEKIPYIAEDGGYREDMGETNIAWWTNGFWSGLLWQLYHATGKQRYMQTAMRIEERLDRTGWMIVDCLMNLSVLYWAAEETDDLRFSAIAKRHADTVIEKILRPDGSCSHIAVMDPMTGEVEELPAGQGCAEGSAWSRGQAWAVYGFAISYAHTKEQRYLDAAKRAAHFFLANAALTGYLPLCDFREPEEPVYYDSTAGACAACGLLEIAKHVPEQEKALYERSALKMLMAMEEKFCNWKEEEDGILGMGKVAYHEEGGNRQVPIIYGDYFFTEAVLRLMGKEFFIW